MANESAAAAAAVLEASVSYAKEVAASVTKEVSESVTKEVSTSVIKETASFFLKIDSHGALAAFAAGMVAGSVTTLGAFYLLKPSESEGAIRRGLESTDETGNALRRVNFVGAGSIIVKLSCYTPQSVLQFVMDLKENKIKRRLEEEFKKIEFDQKLEVTIVCAKVVFQREYATR